MVVFQNWGYLFGGPHNKGLSYIGVYIGVPLFRETTILVSRWAKLSFHDGSDQEKDLDCNR